MDDEDYYGPGSWEGALPDTGGGVYAPGDNLYVGSGPSGGYTPPGTVGYQPPSAGGSSYTDAVSHRSGTGEFSSSNPVWGEMSSWGNGGMGSPPGQGGGGGYKPPPSSGAGFQRIGMGTPDRTLYDHYAKLLSDPSSMSGDPAYQFLFNQGMQALNRTAGAKGMRYSGNTGLAAEKFGQGMASDYMSRMLPQYGAGADRELQRFMGPAGLMPAYAGVNNQATQNEGTNAASAALIPAYQQMLSQPPPSYGGQTYQTLSGGRY